MRYIKPSLFLLFLSLIWLFNQVNAGQSDATAFSGSNMISPIITEDLSPEFPKDGPPVKSKQQAFDEFSWQMFVAMNWPAKSGERGIPDRNKKIGDPGEVVWLTYKTSDETFLAKGADPGPWNKAGKDYSFSFFLDEVTKVDSDIMSHLSSTNQAVGGPLIDQNGNYTYYSRQLNRTEYDFIRDNEFYNQGVLENLGHDLNLPFQSMEVKSAWRILTDKDKKERFYTVEAEIKPPKGEKYKALVGLVGLHLTYKAKNHPQWIWATFEHEDNAPVQVKDGSKPVVKPGVQYSYYNPKCSLEDCPPNQSTKYPKPTQLTRRTDIRAEAASSNQKWQQLLKGTVWENYMLVTTQWSKSKGKNKPRPRLSANITMESYIQLNSSCMNCHKTATIKGTTYGTDYSFLFLGAEK